MVQNQILPFNTENMILQENWIGTKNKPVASDLITVIPSSISENYHYFN